MTDNKQKPEQSGPRPVAIIPCDEIQELLTAYMTKELGESQSALVREHLRKCAKCQAMARDIQSAFDLFAEDRNRERSEHVRLSDRHRARLRRAYMHPLYGWFELHHWLIAIILSILIFAAGLWILSEIVSEIMDDGGDSVPVELLPDEPAIRLEDLPSPALQPAIPDMPLPPTPPLPAGASGPGGMPDAPASILAPMPMPPARTNPPPAM